MLLENYEKYRIISTRTIMYIVVEIYMAGKFKVPSAFKKLIDLCKYGNLEISKRKKQTEVCLLLAKI